MSSKHVRIPDDTNLQSAWRLCQLWDCCSVCTIMCN